MEDVSLTKGFVITPKEEYVWFSEFHQLELLLGLLWWFKILSKCTTPAPFWQRTYIITHVLHYICLCIYIFGIYVYIHKYTCYGLIYMFSYLSIYAVFFLCVCVFLCMWVCAVLCVNGAVERKSATLKRMHSYDTSLELFSTVCALLIQRTRIWFWSFSINQWIDSCEIFLTRSLILNTID